MALTAKQNKKCEGEAIHIRFSHYFFNQKQKSQIFDIEFTTPLKGITALSGASGAGKTTILNVISGLLRPQNGVVHIGENIFFESENNIFIPPHKRNIGYIFQDIRLFPHMNIRDNLSYGMKKATTKTQQKQHFEEMVHLLDISDLLERKPSSLSGGEKQRVAIGRALLSQPQLLLMDEPLSSLDQPRKDEILPYLLALKNQFTLPIIYVSHYEDEIEALADRVVYVK